MTTSGEDILGEGGHDESPEEKIVEDLYKVYTRYSGYNAAVDLARGVHKRGVDSAAKMIADRKSAKKLAKSVTSTAAKKVARIAVNKQLEKVKDARPLTKVAVTFPIPITVQFPPLNFLAVVVERQLIVQADVQAVSKNEVVSDSKIAVNFKNQQYKIGSTIRSHLLGFSIELNVDPSDTFTIKFKNDYYAAKVSMVGNVIEIGAEDVPSAISADNWDVKIKASVVYRFVVVGRPVAVAAATTVIAAALAASKLSAEVGVFLKNLIDVSRGFTVPVPLLLMTPFSPDQLYRIMDDQGTPSEA